MIRTFKDGRVRFECRTPRFSNKYKCREHCDLRKSVRDFQCIKGKPTISWIDYILHSNKVKVY